MFKKKDRVSEVCKSCQRHLKYTINNGVFKLEGHYIYASEIWCINCFENNIHLREDFKKSALCLL